MGQNSDCSGLRDMPTFVSTEASANLDVEFWLRLDHVPILEGRNWGVSAPEIYTLNSVSVGWCGEHLLPSGRSFRQITTTTTYAHNKEVANKY